MNLTDGEKLIVALLADIHTHLGVQGDVDAARVKTALYSNHLWSLKWTHPMLFVGSEPDEETIQETGNYLTMWELIENSYENLSDQEKADVRAQNFNSEPTFEGFDGNNERHYDVAQYMIEALGRWTHFAGRNLNSHGSSVGQYQRMYAVHQEIRAQKPFGGGLLSKDELISVLKA